MGNKIRILLLILTVSFLATAIMINNMVTKDDMLELDTRTLSSNIHEYEDIVEDLFADSNLMKAFVNVEVYPTQVLDVTNTYGDKYKIFFYIYKDHKPIFWSNNIYVPETDLGLSGDVAFIQEENRSFILKRKTLTENTSVLALIPVQTHFSITNEYLSNVFFNQLISTNNLKIADYQDPNNVKNIYSKNGSYMFSVKLNEGKHDNIFMDIQFICWIFASICFLILVNNICLMIAQSGKPWFSLIFFAFTLILTRYVDLNTNWLASSSSIGLFDPKYYAYSPLLPNLWGFFMTTLLVAWLVFYFRSIQPYLKVPLKYLSGNLTTVVSLISILAIYFIGNLLFFHLSTLITNSTAVTLDLTNLLSFNSYSWLNILIICINMVILLYFIDTVVSILKSILPNTTSFLNIQLIALVTAITLNAILVGESTFFNIFLAGVIMLRAYSKVKVSLSLSTFILTLVFLAFMTTSVYMRSLADKVEREMKVTINQLEAEDDLNATALFADLEDKIISDRNLRQSFAFTLPNTKTDVINDYIKHTYFSGYLSKFEFNGYYYYNNQPLGNYDNNKIEEYREKVINKSTKVLQTDHFYRLRSDLGTHEYFLQFDIPINETEDQMVQVFINLRNRAYGTALSYPEILSDSKVKFIHNFQNNATSFALYRNGTLVTQNGSFTYPNKDDTFEGKVEQYVKMEDYNGYFNVVYKPDEHTTLVVSTPRLSLWQSVAVFSFLFLCLYIYFMVFDAVKYLFSTITQKSFNLRSIRYHFKLLINRIQYSTRIQTMIIGVVIFAIVISGFISFISISGQLEKSKVQQRSNYIMDVIKKIESKIQTSGNLTELQIQEFVKEFSASSVTDINLYNKNGKLIFTSQPKIYDMGLVSKYINPIAFNNLNVLKKSDSFLKEQILRFEYNSSYATIKNSEYNNILFLNIPYFTSVEEENESQNLLLNTLLNIYTIIILGLGFLTVMVANSITKPLNLIGKKLSQTIFSNKPNEPLYWERDDEIGALVKEYNFMIVKLEENAKQLLNAEREYAWREMAKQIAHEIKNPLTPMKLGIQQLTRSYTEDDPKFEERFFRISNSFIEQINSLSKIATEFSNFARLPDTNLIKINLVEKINKSANVYHNNHNTYIKIINNTDDESVYVLGDRDQLLRTFNNLIKNSIEASIGRKKHLISILIEYIEEEKIKIIVKDNGMGIPANVIPKIFQPNFTTKSSGTGLGLAFVKKTIESMKGEISFVTFEGIGTTFTIILPIYKENGVD